MTRPRIGGVTAISASTIVQARTVLRFAPNLAFGRVSTLTRSTADRIRRYSVTPRPPG